MEEVNYIKHLNAVFLLFSKDNRLNPTHISLYMALFQLWNTNRFPREFFINRSEVMQLSKIGSKSTYHRCIKELHHWSYIIYSPSHNPYKGSKINILQNQTTTKQVQAHNNPNLETTIKQALVPIYKHIQTNKNNNKTQHLKKSEVSHIQKNNKQNTAIPNTDNLKVSTNKNYNEPL